MHKCHGLDQQKYLLTFGKELDFHTLLMVSQKIFTGGEKHFLFFLGECRWWCGVRTQDTY